MISEGTLSNRERTTLKTIISIGRDVANITIEPSKKKGLCSWVLDAFPLGIGFLNWMYRISDEEGEISGGPVTLPYLTALAVYQTAISIPVINKIVENGPTIGDCLFRCYDRLF